MKTVLKSNTTVVPFFLGKLHWFLTCLFGKMEGTQSLKLYKLQALLGQAM